MPAGGSRRGAAASPSTGASGPPGCRSAPASAGRTCLRARARSFTAPAAPGRAPKRSIISRSRHEAGPEGRMRLPTSCYRLQFRDGMDFDRAAGLVPYLADLGVSHLYASPLFTAETGSAHGYDVTDPREIDPALGGRAGLERLSAALKEAGLGLILDIVPNHMAFSVETPWLRDVLRHGSQSRYAGHFDLDPAAGRLRLPWLTAPPRKVPSARAAEGGQRPDRDRNGQRSGFANRGAGRRAATGFRPKTPCGSARCRGSVRAQLPSRPPTAARDPLARRARGRSRGDRSRRSHGPSRSLR